MLNFCISFWFWIMHGCIPTSTTDNNTSTGMILVTLNMGRSAANRLGNVIKLSGNFKLLGDWSPYLQAGSLPVSFLLHIKSFCLIVS